MSESPPPALEGRQPRVSVIIPAYRVTDFIAETLKSVFNQTYTDYEVIVVNDGCPDTAGLETAIAPYRDRIRYIVQANGGPSRARNTAIRASRGSLIAQLDGDDQWYPNFLESQVRFLDAHPDVDVVFTDAIVFGGSDDGLGLFALNRTEGPITLASLMNQRVVVLTSSVMARRESFERVGLYDEALRAAEDFDLWLRLAAAGFRLEYYREILVRHRRGTKSVSSDKTMMLNSALAVLDKSERMMTLTPAERDTLEEGRVRLRSQRSFLSGRTALRRGDAALARREFANVKPSGASVRLRILRAALRVAPRLTVAAYRRIKGINSSIDA